MPIKIADGLDAVSELKKEGIVTIGEKRARTQDIRPLHILILNLMPIKKPTEVQLLRLLGGYAAAAGCGFCPYRFPGNHPYGPVLPG